VAAPLCSPTPRRRAPGAARGRRRRAVCALSSAGVLVERRDRRREGSGDPTKKNRPIASNRPFARRSQSSPPPSSGAGGLLAGLLLGVNFALVDCRLPVDQRRLLAVAQAHRLPRRAFDRVRLPLRVPRRVRIAVWTSPTCWSAPACSPASSLRQARHELAAAGENPAQRAVLLAYRPQVPRSRCGSPAAPPSSSTSSTPAPPTPLAVLSHDRMIYTTPSAAIGCSAPMAGHPPEVHDSPHRRHAQGSALV